MPLQVLPASEADAARVVALEQVAFRDDPLAPYLFPGPFPTEGDTRAETLIKQLQEESRCKWVKVVDTDLAGKGEEPMVAFSQWYVWDPPRLRGQNPSDHWGAGTNPEACELFFGGMLKMQDARFDGIPFLCKSSGRGAKPVFCILVPLTSILLTSCPQTSSFWPLTLSTSAEAPAPCC